VGGKLSRSAALLVAAATGVLSVLIGATPALAHNPLTASDPKDGARLSRPPSVVRLTFLSRLDPATTKVTVTGPGGTGAVASKPTVAGKNVSIPVRPTAAGIYTVAWELVADDGDKVGGKIRFTLTVPAVPAPSVPAPSAANPSAAPGSAVAAGSPTETARTLPVANSTTTWWPWVLGAVVLLAAVTGAVILARRRRT
jgi:methionine-rich copper-binding protein CopC